MSGVEIYTFDLKGDASHYNTAKNAWGYAMHIWETLAPKYGVKYSLFSSMGNPDLLKPLWNIAYRTDVSRQDRIMMSLTYDRTWVKKEHLNEAIEVVEAFIQTHPTETLKQFLAILQSIDQTQILGIGLNANSVSCDYWSPISVGKKDKTRPFNLHKDLEDHGELLDVFLYQSTDEHDLAGKAAKAKKQADQEAAKKAKKAKKVEK